ncbi:MAG: hypothetical protein U0326_02110 [Polyangiales bacterium]
MTIYLASVIATVLHLKRVCARCKREQVVAFGQRAVTVRCRFCQHPIAPPAASKAR